jgi:hypothetical protein
MPADLYAAHPLILVIRTRLLILKITNDGVLSSAIRSVLSGQRWLAHWFDPHLDCGTEMVSR